MMRISKTSIAGAALLAALAAGAVVPAAFAQDADDPADTETESPQDRHAAAQQDFAEALADELGIGVARVTAALETVQTELAEQRQAEHLAELEARLDAAVADGSLTREEADAILDAHEAGVIGGFGGHGPGGHGRGGSGGRPGGFPPAPSDGAAAGATNTSV